MSQALGRADEGAGTRARRELSMTLDARPRHRDGSRLVPNNAQPRIMPTGPWVDVVHIETQKGPRGGEEWRLTLACTHVAFRPYPKFTVQTMIRRVMEGPRGAPKKVRCIVCARTRGGEQHAGGSDTRLSGSSEGSA